MVLQKLLVISIVIFVRDNLAAAYAIMCVHGLYFGFQVLRQPYFDPRSDYLAASVSFASALNPLLIVLAHYGVINYWPEAAMQVVVIVVNFGLPLLALTTGWVCSRSQRKELMRKQDVIEQDFTEVRARARANAQTRSSTRPKRARARRARRASRRSVRRAPRRARAGHARTCNHRHAPLLSALVCHSPCRQPAQVAVLKLEKERRELDLDLNTVTLKYMLRVFVALAATSFIAVALLMLAQFWQAATTKVVATTQPTLGNTFRSASYATCEIESLIAKNELADYPTWGEFTKHCCCSDRESEYSYGPAFVAERTELWSCDNGYFKERRRSLKAARDFCSPSFNAGYSLPAYKAASAQIGVVGPDDNII
jgi:ABC-type multidrug transport system fused ATPase/permease subunit